MPWLELSVATERRLCSRIERAFEDMGALSVTLTDPDDVAAILEPRPGETPLWPTLTATALFPAACDRRGLVAVLVELAPWIQDPQISLRDVADEDWTRAWMDQFQPMRFGRRLWVYPSTHEPTEDPDAVVVRLDPGLAFGTGTHPTTASCLAWLDGLALEGRSVLDWGTGSGILALAALKLGAARAVGVDLDAQALVASRDNASRNGIGAELELVGVETALLSEERYDVVVANILAGPLVELAPTLARHAHAGAPVALSGILATQAEEVAAAYRPFLDEVQVEQREDWVIVHGRRATR